MSHVAPSIRGLCWIEYVTVWWLVFVFSLKNGTTYLSLVCTKEVHWYKSKVFLVATLGDIWEKYGFVQGDSSVVQRDFYRATLCNVMYNMLPQADAFFSVIFCYSSDFCHMIRLWWVKKKTKKQLTHWQCDNESASYCHSGRACSQCCSDYLWQRKDVRRVCSINILIFIKCLTSKQGYSHQ